MKNYHWLAGRCFEGPLRPRSIHRVDICRLVPRDRCFLLLFRERFARTWSASFCLCSTRPRCRRWSHWKSTPRSINKHSRLNHFKIKVNNFLKNIWFWHDFCDLLLQVSSVEDELGLFDDLPQAQGPVSGAAGDASLFVHAIYSQDHVLMAESVD